MAARALRCTTTPERAESLITLALSSTSARPSTNTPSSPCRTMMLRVYVPRASSRISIPSRFPFDSTLPSTVGLPEPSTHRFTFPFVSIVLCWITLLALFCTCTPHIGLSAKRFSRNRPVLCPATTRFDVSFPITSLSRYSPAASWLSMMPEARFCRITLPYMYGRLRSSTSTPTIAFSSTMFRWYVPVASSRSRKPCAPLCRTWFSSQSASAFPFSATPTTPL
mmetsp:Transcript_14072/g.33344  ORF Transcript_14072/g.33344 Transcript_14072/m.33344 type:complete len:224 (-) Transcript_14072:1085-1756(-)